VRDCVADPRWRVARRNLEQWLGLERDPLRKRDISAAHVVRLLYPVPVVNSIGLTTDAESRNLSVP
jgi:hypothetical protein